VTWQSNVTLDWGHDGVKILLAEKVDGRRFVYTSTPVEVNEVGDGVELPPFMRLTVPAAKAVYEALSEYFGGSPPTQTQREDYLHERGRVDQMISHLIGRATTNG